MFWKPKASQQLGVGSVFFLFVLFKLQLWIHQRSCLAYGLRLMCITIFKEGKQTTSLRLHCSKAQCYPFTLLRYGSPLRFSPLSKQRRHYRFVVCRIVTTALDFLGKLIYNCLLVGFFYG